jgi:hypothetical protein
MSYKYKILKDNPLALYMLEEVRSGDSSNYTSILSQFATYQDLKDNGVSYATLSGMPVWDSSGNGFDGFATDASDKEIFPIISGAIRGTEVRPITILHFPVKGIANSTYADDEFSIEVWASLPQTTNGSIPLIADSTNNIGLFYENGTITFSVQGQSISQTVVTTEALYIVASFTASSIYLYIDGVLKQNKSLNNFLFTNDVVNFACGPSNETFVIDGLAFYKKTLSQSQILNHYNAGNVETPTTQIVNPDGGVLFSMNTNKTTTVFEYEYPKAKPWNYFADSNVEVSLDQQYIYIKQTDIPSTANFSFTDSIVVPDYLNISSSLIFFDDDSYGITVEASIDETNWIECENSMPLPFFNKNDNQIENVLYIRVTMTSSDTSKYFPTLRKIRLLFFSDKDCYSDNSGARVFSDYDYGLPHKNHLNLSYCKMNGLKMYDGHGFSTDYSENVKTIEMIFTPDGGSNVLFSTQDAIYGWDSSGNIYSTNVLNVHINGIDVTSHTNISDHFISGYQHHVAIVLEDDCGLNIKFNQNQDDSQYGGANVYTNIALYDSELLESELYNHYLLYTDRYSTRINDTSLSLAESVAGQDGTAFYIVERQPLATNI